ncbi:GFA family protein [Rhizobium sp. GR12]|uniref:GFA family protein n=1 Tax=Rhizobium TaxID=379 RepID=UPI002FBD3BF1
MMRLAHCSCHQLTVVAKDEPSRVSVCHCRACQQRTGSAFGVAVFYEADQVTASGEHQTYVRAGDSGKDLKFHFCPVCGSTVYWIAEFRPGLIAVAMGCFEDPGSIVPTQSVYEATRHPWVSTSF